MSDYLELQEFFVEGDDQKSSHVLLHITEPSTPEEFEKGYFFALAEINNGTLEHIEHLQKMIDDLESGFYATEEDGKRDAFESTLEYINRRGHKILEDKGVNVHCFVGLIKDHHISFAFHGDMHALLFYRGKTEAQAMNILDGADADKEPGQLFSSIIQGKMNTGDFLFVGTPHIAEYFSYDRIQKVITSRSVKQSTSHVEHVLKDVTTDNSFGGVVFRMLAKAKKPPKVEVAAAKRPSSSASLDSLISARKKTAETLSPPLLKNFMNSAKSFRGNEAPKKKAPEKQRGRVETNYRYREQKEKSGGQNVSNAILIGLGRAIVAGATGIFELLKQVALLIGKALLALFIIITNKNNSRRDVLLTGERYFSGKKRQFDDMPLVSKGLFLATLIAAVIFIGSIGTVKVKEGYQAKKQAYTNLVQAVIDKKDAAEASLIYDDQEKAFTLLKEAEDLLSGFPTDKKSRKLKKLELATDVDALMMKLRNIETAAPEQLVNLSEQFGDVRASGMTRVDNTLVVYSQDDAQTYEYSIDTGKTSIHDQVDTIKPLFASTPKEQNEVVLIEENGEAANYNKDSKKLSEKDIFYPVDNVSVGGAVVYNQRLYTVDKNSNQVYKHNKTQTGYDKGTTWLKDDYDLSSASGIAIDGDVFVLSSDKLFKFEKGIEQDFTLGGLDPQLSNPTFIYTYNDVDFIYILEPTNKRVIMLDKDGNLDTQYTSDEWTKLQAMVVDEPERTIYILNDNKIQKFSY
jgi:hypothetical protein